MRRSFAPLILSIAAALAAAAPAGAADPDAPPGAPAHWLPDEQWVNLLWLPFEEERLYRLLGRSRGDIFRWVRIDAHHTLAQLARRRGIEPERLAAALVAPRRGEVSPRQLRRLRRSALRVLRNGHLSQHMLFHALHQTAVPDRATAIFGTRTRLDFLRLRRWELSPLQIGELHGRTRVSMHRGAERALRAAAALGMRRGYLTDRQRRTMIDRQLRQLPRWLGQRRYNGPSEGRNALRLPAGDQAKHPSLSADGRVLVWDAYRMDRRRAEQLGEIHVRALDMASGRRTSASPRVLPGSRRPQSSYNAVVSGDGRIAAFETAQSTYPLAKRVGQMSVLVCRLPGRSRFEKVSHAGRAADAPTRTAFNPSLSGDGRLVSFEATDSGRGGATSRNGLWLFDRATGAQTLLAEHGNQGAAYLPRLAADGSAVAFTEVMPGGDGRTQVYVRSLHHGTTALVSRADGPGGAPADTDAYEPAISADGSVVAFATRARNLGGIGRGSRVYIRDLRAGTTRLASAGMRGDAVEPAISPDGRHVAFVVRRRFSGGSLDRLRSRVWLHDRATGRTALASRADGPRGAPADGYASEPSVAAGGRLVAFTSTAGNLSAAKPRRLAGIFVRDLAANRTRLVSEHRVLRP